MQNDFLARRISPKRFIRISKGISYLTCQKEICFKKRYFRDETLQIERKEKRERGILFSLYMKKTKYSTELPKFILPMQARIRDFPEIKKRATPAGGCLPIQVLLVPKQCKTARLIPRNFLWYKKRPCLRRVSKHFIRSRW